MYLTWGNITVTNDQKAISRGIQVSLGTPPQILSLRPSTTDDNLYIANKAQCQPNSNNTCLGTYGGVFDYNRSDTFAQVSAGQWNGSGFAVPDQSAFIHFNDLFTLGNASFPGYPVLYPELSTAGQGVLPLSSHSDLLRIAVEDGVIPSTVYGLWTGSRSINHPVDGALTLGGYDTSRVNGVLSTFASAPRCECCVIVTGLEYNDANGTRSLFANSTQTFQISLQPGVKYLSMPQDVWEIFRDASGGTYERSLGMLAYSADDSPTGNLTVTLQGGYKTTIPAEELFQNPRYFDEDGEYAIYNNTYLTSTIYNTTDISHSLYWGIPYLTMNYLVGDYKRQQFKMAPAIRNDFGYAGAGFLLEASCDPTTKNTASAISSATAVPQHSGGTHTGAIAGGVVGGVVGLAAILGIFMFWYIRRRKSTRRYQQRQQNGNITADGEPGMSQLKSTELDTTSSPTELDSAIIPGELDGARSRTELADSQRSQNTKVDLWRSSQASDVSHICQTLHHLSKIKIHCLLIFSSFQVDSY